MPTPSLLRAPQATAALKRGFDQLAELLAVTLGPTQGIVISSAIADGHPEILNDAATIARRVMQLPDRAEDVGAMLLRNLAWRMSLKAGDGSALAAVLAQAILHGAHRYIAAGGNAMMVRRSLGHAARAPRAALEALAAQARPVRDAQELANVALAVTGEHELSRLLGEMFMRLGADAHIIVEEYMARYLACDYHEGGRWKARIASAHFNNDALARRATQPDCYVVLCAGDLASIADVQPILELVAQTETKRVAIIAHEIKGEALNALILNHQPERLQIIGVEARSASDRRVDDFEDLSVLSDAQILAPERGRSWRNIRASDFGAAQRVEANADELIVVGYTQHAAQIQAQAEQLRKRSEAADDDAKKWLRERLARMEGRVATLKIGGATESERVWLKQQAEKALKTLPMALREGVAPGGGVAYVNCIEAVRRASGSMEVRVDADEREAGAHNLDTANFPYTVEETMGAEILARALAAPFHRIARNAGATATGALLAEARRQGTHFGYDARHGKIAEMDVAGIMDAVGVLRFALETALSGAMLALTTDTIVLHQNPQMSYEP